MLIQLNGSSSMRQNLVMSYSFEIDAQRGLLTLEFWGDYVGAGTDEAILSVLADVPLLERRKITRFAVDCRKVDSATLEDTDFSRVRRSERQFQHLLEMTDVEYRKHLEGLSLAAWIDSDSPTGELLVERLQRVHRSSNFGSAGICTTREQYLMLLNLPPSLDISG